MSVNGSPKQRLFATLSAFAILCSLASCASSGTDAAKTADTASSDSALLEDSTKVGSTDVPETAAFSDLNAKEADQAKMQSAAEEKAAPAADGDTYYSSVGGETLRRVAYTLYSDKSFAKQLLTKNPDLKGVKRLAASQKVYFDMDSARPEPRYLTKDLLDRYAQPLAEKIESAEKGLNKSTVTLNKGESLQDLSQRLYGTHRYWTEIYLVNRDKIKNYDRVTAGISLTVVDRPGAGVAKAEAPAAATIAKEEKEELPPPPPPVKAEKPVPVVSPVAAVLPTQPEPLPTQKAEAPVKEAPRDPIPEIPPLAEKAPTPPPTEVKPLVPEPVKAEPLKPMAEATKPLPAPQLDQPETSSNSSLRRILYVVLILAIGGAAFYFTRTPKRPKVDMLDLNAEAGARPKLAPKDSQQSNIG